MTRNLIIRHMQWVNIRTIKPGQRLLKMDIRAAWDTMKCSSYFYWELVTLIDVMLLGHWIEMRRVRQACGALIMSISTVVVTINAQLLRKVNNEL